LKKELWITEEETDNLSQCVIVFPADEEFWRIFFAWWLAASLPVIKY